MPGRDALAPARGLQIFINARGVGVRHHCDYVQCDKVLSMPMFVPLTASRETGLEEMRNFSAWLSQVRRQ